MTLIERLKRYNAWRRGETDDPQPHPKQIGKDIDEAIAKLAAADQLAEAVDNLTLPICGRPACKHCKDAREAKDALAAYQARKEQDDE